MFIKEKLYKEILDKTIIQTLDIVFINENKQILLGLRNNNPLKGVYYILGGRRYKNETIVDSAKRKAKEELGININEDKLKFLNIYDDIFKNSAFKNISTHCSSITFVYILNKQEEENITLDGQHSDFKYFDLDDIFLHEMIKNRIKEIKKLKII